MDCALVELHLGHDFLIAHGLWFIVFLLKTKFHMMNFGHRFLIRHRPFVFRLLFPAVGFFLHQGSFLWHFFASTAVWLSILGSSFANVSTMSALHHYFMSPPRPLFGPTFAFLLISRAYGLCFLQTRYRRKAGFKPVSMVQLVFSFDVVLMDFSAIKVQSSVLHSGRHILSIRSPIWEFFISLERSFWPLFSDASCFSRFFSRHIPFSLLCFCILVDNLVVSDPGIDFFASNDSSWLVLSFVLVLCLFWSI